VLYFLQGATLGLSATAAPGPFQAFLMSQTLKNGWRHTLPAAFAPLLSDIPIVTLVLLVLTQTPDWLLSGLQIAGGVFLLFLAWNAYRSIWATGGPRQAPVESARQGFLKGMLMNALSPGPYIFWSVLAGPIVLEAWRTSPGQGLSFVLGFYGMLIGGFVLFVFVFATASRFGPRMNRILRAVSAVALLLFGVYQLYTGIGALV